MLCAIMSISVLSVLWNISYVLCTVVSSAYIRNVHVFETLETSFMHSIKVRKLILGKHSYILLKC